MNLVDAQTIENLSSSNLFAVIEFAALAIIIIATYMGMHAMFTRVKPATKMLLSMFLGSLAYGIGKLTVITLLVNPFVSAF